MNAHANAKGDSGERLEGIAFADETERERIKLWHQRDEQRQTEAIRSALEIRSQVDKTVPRNTPKDERDFEAIYWAAVRIYMVQRIVEDCDSPTEALRRGIAEGFQDVLDEIDLRKQGAPEC